MIQRPQHLWPSAIRSGGRFLTAAARSAAALRSRCSGLGLLAAVGVLHCAHVAHAQWTTQNLHPAGDWEVSRVWGVFGSQQVGHVYQTIGGPSAVPSGNAGSVWGGSAGSFSHVGTGEIFGIASDHSVGYVELPIYAGHVGIIGYRDTAAMWTDSGATFNELAPPGSASSAAYATSGTHQVGYATMGGTLRAAMWSGTAASWVDLHPAGAAGSTSVGVWGTQQVGIAHINSDWHASLWSGTADSWIDLHPAGASTSSATSVFNARQGGSATFAGAKRAGLWSGDAETWLDITPAGATDAEVNGMFGDAQVGYAVQQGLSRASLWQGTAASWLDLGAFLPQDYTQSWATCIWSDGNQTIIGGYAVSSTTGGYHAVIWSIPSPSAVALAALAGHWMLARRRR